MKSNLNGGSSANRPSFLHGANQGRVDVPIRGPGTLMEPDASVTRGVGVIETSGMCALQSQASMGGGEGGYKK